MRPQAAHAPRITHHVPMGLLDFILNLVGLLLWFNWRAARFDPLSKSTPATLAGTLRRAEKTSLKVWHLPLGILVLLVVRALFYNFIYSEFGSALNWAGRVDFGVISVPFCGKTSSLFTMLLYSIYSFGVTLGVFLMWALLLSVLKTNAPENDSLRLLLRLHLGDVERWSWLTKSILPLLIITPLWWVGSWLLTHWTILPPVTGAAQRAEQAILVGLGSYLAWKYLIVGALFLYFVNSYVYFGKQPFWQHLEVVGRLLLWPMRRLPLRFGKMDFSPLAGIGMVLLAAQLLQYGIQFPSGNDASGKAKARWIDVPGLVDLYTRASK
jgi:uncharacterized protein YggT (Ycf19 family)